LGDDDQPEGRRAGRPWHRGLRIPIDRFTAKVKLSQDKDPVSVQNVIERLREPGPYHQPHLADDMERARDEAVQ
jgi:transcriptional regulator